jgi:Flp pilus assembly pilin Flp
MRDFINRSQWRFTTSEYGASMVEYALLVMLIAMIAVAALTFVGGEVSTSYSEVADGFNNPN